jgi:transcriptional regulator with XRE-family HTH domain
VQRAAPLDTIAAAVRRERERLGISLTELARRAGVAKSTLSQVEAGTGNPSVETLWALAVELGVPFSRIVDPPAEPIQVIRAGDGYVVHSEQAPFAAVLLSTCPPGARRDLHILRAEPGGTREAHAHIAGTTEHLIVLTGRWSAGPEDEPIELAVGDYLRFRGDRPHRYEALEPGSSAVLVMEHI